MATTIGQIVESGMASIFVTLTTKFPCCGRTARIRATNDVPREQYDRKCKCGCKWEVERRTARQGKNGRVDVVEWTPVTTTWEYAATGCEGQRITGTVEAKTETEARVLIVKSMNGESHVINWLNRV